MYEIEKKQLLKDLNDLNKGLISYKKRQEKREQIQFTEGQKKNLDALRSRLQVKYRWLKEIISKYGGNTSVKILGVPWDAFVYSLRSLNMTPKQFTTLDKAINLVNKAIGKIESTPVTSTDWRDISITQEPVDTTELLSYLFDKMQFHPRVIAASKSLFRDGHYASAILEAYKAVNNFVKEKTNLALDGKALMSKVFNEDAPIIKLNELLTQSDRDEQEGFKFLFMGAMVGIRNPKAHEDIRQIDPHKALEYLSFASLLMRRATEGKLEIENK